MTCYNARIVAFNSANIKDTLSHIPSTIAILRRERNAPLVTFLFILEPSTRIWIWFLHVIVLNSATFFWMKAMGLSSLVNFEKLVLIIETDQLNEGFGGM